jgi:hypothetical protein
MTIGPVTASSVGNVTVWILKPQTLIKIEEQLVPIQSGVTVTDIKICVEQAFVGAVCVGQGKSQGNLKKDDRTVPVSILMCS